MKKAGFVLAAWLLAACQPGYLPLVVEVRTDLIPGVEFVSVRTDVEGHDSVRSSADLRDRSFLQGTRVAEFSLAPGQQQIHVVLMDSEGVPIAERTVVVSLVAASAVTIVISRDCRGVRCPATETCFGGRCVSRECLYGDEAACPPPECRDAAECGAAAECGSAQCAFGVCLYEADDTQCTAERYCHPECGCIPLPPPSPDGGVLDADNYCGACGVDCDGLPNVLVGRCEGGECRIEQCAEGFGDCDGDPANGCERVWTGWDPITGGDHCGEDWVLADGDVIGGDHTGVGLFLVPDGAQARVVRFDEDEGGEVRIEAMEIRIEGVLDASGAGYRGGDGGGGRRSGDPYCGGTGGAGQPGTGPNAGGGGGGGRGHGGTHHTDSGCRYANGADGSGGGNGGYAAAGVNGDESEGDEVWIGSGGGGGGGGGSGSRYGGNNNFPAGPGSGGGGGGRGGGALRLVAHGPLSLRGSIVARGTRDAGDGGDGEHFTSCDRYANGRGGRGGSHDAAGSSRGGARVCQGACTSSSGATNTCGGAGGRGGAGAGGGVLLAAQALDAEGGTIDVSGGADANGGTVKLRFACTHVEGAYLAGRVDARSRGSCE